MEIDNGLMPADDLPGYYGNPPDPERFARGENVTLGGYDRCPVAAISGIWCELYQGHPGEHHAFRHTTTLIKWR